MADRERYPARKRIEPDATRRAGEEEGSMATSIEQASIDQTSKNTANKSKEQGKYPEQDR
jgi:hypothetical protein